MKIGPEQNVQMPMKTVISLIVMVALGTFGYFQIQDTYLQSNNVILPRSSAQNTIQQRSNIPLIFPQL